MDVEAKLGTVVPAETKTIVSVNLSASFENLAEALEFVETVKSKNITSFNISQYESYRGDIPF